MKNMTKDSRDHKFMLRLQQHATHYIPIVTYCPTSVRNACTSR